MGGKESTEEGEGGGKWSRRSTAGSGGGMSDHETEASDEKTKRSEAMGGGSQGEELRQERGHKETSGGLLSIETAKVKGIMFVCQVPTGGTRGDTDSGVNHPLISLIISNYW